MGFFNKQKNKKGKSGEAIIAIMGFGCSFLGLLYGGFDREDYYFWPVVGLIVGIFVGAAISSSVNNVRRKKADAARIKKKEEELRNLDTVRFDRVIEYLKQSSGKTVYHIKTDTSYSPSLTDSKFGGYPYWTEGKEYPTSSDGKKLVLLAQINFGKEHLDDGLLPESGLLQFFVADDDTSGCDFGDGSKQSDFRIVYHKEPIKPMSIEELKAAGIKSNTDLHDEESVFPFFKELGLAFEKDTDYISDCVTGFDEMVKGAYKTLFDEGFDGNVWDHLNETEYEYLIKPFNTFGHKILGYPGFTQWDPRCLAGDARLKGNTCTVEHYDVLLLQMDSDDEIMWGDCGVCNFFINSESLKRLDFSDVYYTWDCC